MRMFIINLCVVASAIWLTAGFSHLIIGWYSFDQIQKFNWIFWKAQLLGTLILTIAFIALWSVHVKFLTNKPLLLEGMFIILITVGIPIIKFPIMQLYLSFKNYEEK